MSQGMAAMFGRLALATENTGVGGKRLIDVFGDVGINFRDVKAAMDGTSEGFINVLRLMNEAELSTTQLTALLSTLAGHSYAASISYAVQNPEKLDWLLAEIDSSTGEIVRNQEIILSGASGGLKLMMAQIDTLLNRLAQLGVLTAIEKFTRGISKLVSWLTATNEKDELVRGGLLRMVTIMGGLLAALLPLGIALKAVSFALNGLVPLLKIAAWANKQFGISTTFAAIANSKFVLSLKATRIGMLLTGATARVMWASITGPIGIAVALIGILVYKFRRQIVGALKTALSWIKSNWPLLVGILLGPFGIAGALIWKFRRQIVGALKTALSWIKSNWPLLVGILLGPFGIVGALVWKFRDQILGAFQDVWDWLRESPIFGPVIDGIQAIIDFVSELPERVVGILKDIPGMVADAIRDIPGLGGAIKVFTGIADRIPFAKGGIVPGPLGKPLLATVHGGEMVIPASARQVMLDMFEGFKLGAAGLPTPSPGAATIYRQSINNRPTVNFSGGINITINTSPGADSTEIAEDVAQNIADAVDKAIGKTFRDIAHDFDGPIER